MLGQRLRRWPALNRHWLNVLCSLGRIWRRFYRIPRTWRPPIPPPPPRGALAVRQGGFGASLMGTAAEEK